MASGQGAAAAAPPCRRAAGRAHQARLGRGPRGDHAVEIAGIHACRQRAASAALLAAVAGAGASSAGSAAAVEGRGTGGGDWRARPFRWSTPRPAGRQGRAIRGTRRRSSRSAADGPAAGSSGGSVSPSSIPDPVTGNSRGDGERFALFPCVRA